ncbi:acyl-CoA dehydrogenase family protein [Ideonella sp.]|uniref:acyl-CoA dehydrogenase family protein n=1 Tax=Ideonella sp. TaxID=1929293 RepID=UPI002B47CFCC|nr:acyl-CoA dehydrogenase family protein [Ideonella sp.]HJV72180.1 acyl-CoA dehydrogenase family protein [Ideonella sp.]
MNTPTATHEVTNQAAPLAGANLFDGHRALREALAFHAPGLDLADLRALGAAVGSAGMQAHARLANLHQPVLHTHDRQGRRVDEVEFHPSYHALMASVVGHGLHGTPWAEGPGGHLRRAAGFMLFTEAEPSVMCPVSMSYAVTPALKANAALHADWSARVTAPVYDARPLPMAAKNGVTLGMGMTEKQGGSDVRSNTTRAERDGADAWGERYRITGHKWFFSAPQSDAHLVLAQTAGGLSCFLVPRWLPDWLGEGARNRVEIQRLKDKLGNHANASSEVEFREALGWRVGDEGRGVPQILAMGALTRLDCALGTAGLMRQALSLAIHHTGQREAFGKPLAHHPLMKNVLADLALESEAATALALRVARTVDRTEHGQDPSGHEALMRRVLTPVAKFWVCKRGSHFAQEAMECLGGNGYVEEQGEGVMARIYREMPLNSIWEGAGNIMAIDLLRALRGGPVADALAAELAPARGAHAAFDRLADGLPARLDGLTEEIEARALSRDVALAVQAALLRQHAPDFVFEAFCDSRLARGESLGAFGSLGRAAPFDALIARANPIQ